MSTLDLGAGGLCQERRGEGRGQVRRRAPEMQGAYGVGARGRAAGRDREARSLPVLRARACRRVDVARQGDAPGPDVRRLDDGTAGGGVDGVLVILPFAAAPPRAPLPTQSAPPFRTMTVMIMMSAWWRSVEHPGDASRRDAQLSRPHDTEPRNCVAQEGACHIPLPRPRRAYAPRSGTRAWESKRFEGSCEKNHWPQLGTSQARRPEQTGWLLL